MKTNPNEPINARPYSHDERPSGGCEGDRPQGFQAFAGLTKREYFAAMAMQGMLARSPRDLQEMSISVQFADALIAELNKE